MACGQIPASGGENTLRRYAYHQTVALLTQALQVLRSWPESRER